LSKPFFDGLYCKTNIYTSIEIILDRINITNFSRHSKIYFIIFLVLQFQFFIPKKVFPTTTCHSMLAEGQHVVRTGLQPVRRKIVEHDLIQLKLGDLYELEYVEKDR
jgi:hypothetical protein